MTQETQMQKPALKVCKECGDSYPEEEMEREDVCCECIDDVEEREKDELVSEIQEGDRVDFGAYGRLYVVKKDAGLVSEGMLWVTDIEEDRTNEDARGWYINERYAKKIIEKYEEDEDDD